MAPPFISGRSKLGNFLYGTLAGAVAICPIILAFALEGGFDLRFLLFLAGAPLLGLGVLAAGVTPEVKAMLDDYEAEKAAADKASAARVRSALKRYQDPSN